MGRNLDSVRAAVERAKVIALEFASGTATFYEDGNTAPIFSCPCRVKKPKSSSFDAGNQTEWTTKRELKIKIPQNATTGIVRRGLIVQVSTPDGDPTINHINFIVQSALDSQFSAERTINVSTEINETPRIT